MLSADSCIIKLINSVINTDILHTYEGGVLSIKFIHTEGTVNKENGTGALALFTQLASQGVEVRCLDTVSRSCVAFVNSGDGFYSVENVKVSIDMFSIGVATTIQLSPVSEECYSELLLNCPLLGACFREKLGIYCSNNYLLTASEHRGKIYSTSGLVYENESLSKGYFFSYEVDPANIMHEIAKLICSTKSTELVCSLAQTLDTSYCDEYLGSYFTVFEVTMLKQKVSET